MRKHTIIYNEIQKQVGGTPFTTFIKFDRTGKFLIVQAFSVMDVTSAATDIYLGIHNKLSFYPLYHETLAALGIPVLLRNEICLMGEWTMGAKIVGGAVGDIIQFSLLGYELMNNEEGE